MADRRLTGALLVGGASTRFGSPKALAELDGETLAERAWRLLGEVCDERIAVGKKGDGLELPFPILDDGIEVRAPLAGVVAALRAAANEIVVVLPVDCPLLRPVDLRTLAKACRDAAVPPTGPLPGAYASAALPVLVRALAAGELKIRDVLACLDVAVVELPEAHLANVNDPHQLAALELRERALHAAIQVANAYDIDAGNAYVLKDWNDTVVHLAPHPIVARVATSRARSDARGTFAQELAVVTYAHARGGPVVPPTALLTPGPHEADGLVLSFWEYAHPAAVEPDARCYGNALRELHRSLAGYPARLPSLAQRLDNAAAVVADGPRMAALAEDDRRFLRHVLMDLRARAEDTSSPSRVLHGGAHTGNAIATAAGVRWLDFDTICTGPLEWDLAHLPEGAVAAFPDVDLSLLDLMRDLVSVHVAISCWATYGRAPEVDEAARFHLDRLRRRAAIVRVE